MTAPSFSGQLEQFGEAQLADVSTHDINTSTAQLLLTTVFFTGAAISMAKQLNTPIWPHCGLFLKTVSDSATIAPQE